MNGTGLEVPEGRPEPADRTELVARWMWAWTQRTAESWFTTKPEVREMWLASAGQLLDTIGEEYPPPPVELVEAVARTLCNLLRPNGQDWWPAVDELTRASFRIQATAVVATVRSCGYVDLAAARAVERERDELARAAAELCAALESLTLVLPRQGGKTALRNAYRAVKSALGNVRPSPASMHHASEPPLEGSDEGH